MSRSSGASHVVNCISEYQRKIFRDRALSFGFQGNLVFLRLEMELVDVTLGLLNLEARPGLIVRSFLDRTRSLRCRDFRRRGRTMLQGRPPRAANSERCAVGARATAMSSYAKIIPRRRHPPRAGPCTRRLETGPSVAASPRVHSLRQEPESMLPKRSGAKGGSRRLRGFCRSGQLLAECDLVCAAGLPPSNAE